MLGKKEKKIVITFYTTADAMATEMECKASGIKGRLFPVPRQLSAGCGLAWKSEPELREEIKKLLDEKAIEYEGIYECMV